MKINDWALFIFGILLFINGIAFSIAFIKLSLDIIFTIVLIIGFSGISLVGIITILNSIEFEKPCNSKNG